MHIIEGLETLDAIDLEHQYGDGLESRSVVCVGVFDGVHLGHLRLIHELVELGSQQQAVPAVVTFREHPDQLLRGKAPPLLVSIEHRLRLLRRAGVGRVLLLDFDADIRDLSARQFAERVLARGLRTRGLLLGYDSALGKDRQGNAASFEELGKELGFLVREADKFAVDDVPISSSMIRKAIQEGGLARAHRLLGRWPSAFGIVIEGDHRGAAMGYPTANLEPQSSVMPPQGVYAVDVLHDGELHPGVANLGTRPTFGDGEDRSPLLEVHLLDYNENLYSATLEIYYRAFLRAERPFATAEHLRAQISEDVQHARELLMA